MPSSAKEQAPQLIHHFLGHDPFDLQQIENPGYNRDRGPATAMGVRARYAF
jgi:hypothetical protein